MSDSQTKDMTQLGVWANTAERAVATAGGAAALDCFLSGGDVYDENATYFGGSGAARNFRYRMWAIAVDTATPFLAGVPWALASGNHDYTVYPDATAVDWQSDVSGCRSYDFNGVHVAVLPYLGGWNANYETAFAWLDADLAAARDAEWKIVSIHWGPYATGDHYRRSDAPNLIEALAPICAARHVDLVLQAHDHVFTKTLPYRWDAAGYTTALPNDAVVNAAPAVTNLAGVAYDLDPRGTYYVCTGAAGHRVGENTAYAELSDDARCYTNGVDKIATDTMDVDSAYGAKGTNASHDYSASMFGVLRIDGNRLAYDFYAVATNGLSAPTLVDTLRVAKTANAFRVTPYVQHPATNAMTVMWHAATNGPAVVKWWPSAGGAVHCSDAGTNYMRYASECAYTDGESTATGPQYLPYTIPWQGRYRIEGLATGTRYTYCVELAGAAYTNSFRTVPGKDASVRFIYCNDSETQPISNTSKVTWEPCDVDDSRGFYASRKYFITETEGYTSNIVRMVERKPDFISISGDLVEVGGKQRHWDEFWRHNAGALNDPAGSIPFLATPGNHDYYAGDDGANPGHAGYGNCEFAIAKYLSYFEFEPNDAPVKENQRERFHRLDYGPITLLYIDLNNGIDSDPTRDTATYLDSSFCDAPDFNPGSVQYTWLTNNLADAQAHSKFTFVVGHQVPYSIGVHNRPNGDYGLTTQYGRTGYTETYSGRPVRVLDDVLLKYGVTAFLCGHDEIMEHSRITGLETLTNGTTRAAAVQIYDGATAGDGLRGARMTSDENTNEVFRAHVDAPEIYDANGILVDGGKHYGHMEINVTEAEPGLWTCTIEPVYIFVYTNAQGVAQGFERRVYADVTVVTNDLRAAAPQPVAFYTFSGENGAAVTDVTNLVSEETYAGTAAAYGGHSVTYTNDTPAAYVFSDQSLATRLVTDWSALAFTATNSPAHGGCVTIPELGGYIGELGAAGDFTIECFVKEARYQNWVNVFKFWYQSETSANQLAKYVAYDKGFALQMSSANPVFSQQAVAAVTLNAWHHLAVVYTKADAAWRMYLDGTCFATQTGAICGPGTTRSFKIGGDGTEYENFEGEIACLRVMPCALASSQFMKASSYSAERQAELGGALGFWSFAEGTAGAPVTAAPNDFDPSDALTGLALGTDGTMPVYSDDVPGSGIYAGIAGETPLATGAKSVKFAGNAANNAGSALKLADLRTRLAEAGAFTLEYFFKLDAMNNWRNTFAFYLSGSTYVKLANRTSETSFCTQIGKEYATTLGVGMVGNWHHVAVEWDAVSSNFVTYVDYQKATTITNVPLAATAGAAYFGCSVAGRASEVVDGKIFGLRIMPRLLAPEEMLFAKDAATDDGKTLFHWSFEDDGAEDGTQIATTHAWPNDALNFRGYAAYQNSQKATYSSEVCRPDVAWTLQGLERVAANRFSAYFYGYSPTYANIWSGSQIRQAASIPGEYAHPTNWTFECFLRRDLGAYANGPNGQLLAGFGGADINTQTTYTDWYMYLRSDIASHALVFCYHDAEGAEHASYTDISFEDGKWHHLAVTYDASSKTFVFYVDRLEKCRLAAPSGLRRTLNENWRYDIGRGFNSSGFNGWMDDVRVSTCVRTPAEFLRKGAGLAPMVIRFR